MKFQKVIYLNYFNFSKEHLQDIIFNLLKLIFKEYDYSNEENTHLTPLHLISFLDPKSEWIKSWINNKICLTLIIEYLKSDEKNTDTVMSNILYYYCKFFENNDIKSPKDKFSISLTSDGIFIYKDYIDYLYFIQNIFIIMKISSTNQGKCIFPLNCNTIFNENRNIY